MAHARGVAVEAELGRLPDAVEGGIDDSQASLTDPEQAAAFVAQTGVDCLAVSIGNVHLLTAQLCAGRSGRIWKRSIGACPCRW